MLKEDYEFYECMKSLRRLTGRPNSKGMSSHEEGRIYENLQNKLPEHLLETNKQKSVQYVAENETDLLPEKFRHIRSLKNEVKDEFYNCCSELEREGFSWHQIQIAHQIIGKWMFERNWRIFDDMNKRDSDDDNKNNDLNVDSIPTREEIRTAVNTIQQKMNENEEGEYLITLANGSTGKHASNINVEPSSNMSVLEECCENDINSTEVYVTVDVLMQDSTLHYKEVAETMESNYGQSKMGLETHICLDLARVMSAIVAQIEEKMGHKTILQGFLICLDLDITKYTISTGAVSWAMSLFGPDCAFEPWSYHHDFKDMMKKENKKTHLLSMNEIRFSGLSASSSVLIYHWEDFHRFLTQIDYVPSRLACLVHDALELEYILVVATVFSLFGVHLITPIENLTIEKGYTPSNLKVIFEYFHEVVKDKTIEDSFLVTNKPYFTHSLDKHEGVIKSYGLPVLTMIEKVAKKYSVQCLDLANAIAPKVSDMIAIHRRRFLDSDPSKELDVFEQAPDTVEALCIVHCVEGMLDKSENGKAEDRDEILKETKCQKVETKNRDSREIEKEPSYTKRLKLKWSERYKELSAVGFEKLQAEKRRIEEKKLSSLEELKALGGPFTSAEQVQAYMNYSSISENEKQSRLKNEVTVARDSSISLPRSSPVFDIMKTNVIPRRLKTAVEFAEGLQIYLGKLEDRRRVRVKDFSIATKSYTLMSATIDGNSVIMPTSCKYLESLDNSANQSYAGIENLEELSEEERLEVRLNMYDDDNEDKIEAEERKVVRSLINGLRSRIRVLRKEIETLKMNPIRKDDCEGTNLKQKKSVTFVGSDEVEPKVTDDPTQIITIASAPPASLGTIDESSVSEDTLLRLPTEDSPMSLTSLLFPTTSVQGDSDHLTISIDEEHVDTPHLTKKQYSKFKVFQSFLTRKLSICRKKKKTQILNGGLQPMLEKYMATSVMTFVMPLGLENYLSDISNGKKNLLTNYRKKEKEMPEYETMINQSWWQIAGMCITMSFFILICCLLPLLIMKI